MFKDVEEAINYIQAQKRFTEKKDLSNMINLLKLFNNPHNNQHYIHIAGTNGKGSIASYIANTLHICGYNVGKYVSPYITCFNERIQINDQYISGTDLLNIMNEIQSKLSDLEEVDAIQPSFFELVTLIAFIYFSRQNLDYIVLEAGIGGKLDATNVVIPLITVISNVDYDHMQSLGNSLEEIALNKLGIVKDNVPLVTIQNDQLYSLFKEKCKEKNAQLVYVQREDLKIKECSIEGNVFDYKDFYNMKTSLLGKYQVENASIAIEVLNHLNVSHEMIKEGIASTTWPGRLEIMQRKPLVIFDGAHNIDGIKRLVEFINILKEKKTLRDKKISLYFAVSADKEKDKMIRLLDHLTDEIIFTKFQYKRSDDENYLFKLSKNPNKRILSSTNEVIDEIHHNKDNVIICCGSLYFISELRKNFLKR